MAFNSETRQKAYPVLDPYTGSDSGFIEESAYNKVSGRKGVLVGNWWEQDALERENESVGHETRQVSLKQKRQLQSTLNLIGDRNASTKDLTTTSRREFSPKAAVPKSRAIREKLIEEDLRRQAEDLVRARQHTEQQPILEEQWMQSSHRAEYGYAKPHTDGMRSYADTGEYVNEEPITLYSFNQQAAFSGCTASTGACKFGRNSKFSQPISEYAPKHGTSSCMKDL